MMAPRGRYCANIEIVALHISELTKREIGLDTATRMAEP